MAAVTKTAAHAGLLVLIMHLTGPDAAHFKPPSNFCGTISGI